VSSVTETTSENSGGLQTTRAEPTSSQNAHKREALGLDMRAILRPVAIVLVIGGTFAAVYLAAFHAPEPHQMPIAAVTATAQSAESLQTDVNRIIPGGFEVLRVPDKNAARDAIMHRRAYGAILRTRSGLTLLYAGANGPATTDLLEQVAGSAAKDSGTHLIHKDILPSAPGDTRGLSIFYLAFGLLVAVFLFGTMTYQVGPRLKLWERLVSLMIFGIASGVLMTFIAKVFGAVPGSPVALAGVIILLAVAAGAFVLALVRLLGPLGASLAAIVLLAFGNSTGGGVLPTDFLPGWLHPFSEFLPVGAAVRALWGIAYFRHDGLVSGVLILCGWIAVCVAALYLRDVRDARNSKGKDSVPKSPPDVSECPGNILARTRTSLAAVGSIGMEIRRTAPIAT
jgi:hypothetical protein